jgi:hypothetical protein
MYHTSVMVFRTPGAAAVLLSLAWTSYAAADAMDIAMGQLQLTTERSVTRGCTRITSVRDDSLKDLRKKIVRAGGDTALLTFSASELSYISAEVYRCAGAAAQSAPPPPAAQNPAPAAAPRPAPAPAPAEPPLWKPKPR